MNFEDEVAMLRTKMFFFDQLAAELDGWKKKFRAYAETAAKGAMGITSLHFMDGKGGYVQVTLPDVDKAANRTQLTGPKLKLAAEAGIDLNVEGMTEETRSFVLTGEWVDWLDGVRAQWQQQGIKEPDGLTEKKEVKLTVAGIAKLREFAAAGAEKAGEFLKAALKSGSVSAK
jgi:hypothetical protein